MHVTVEVIGRETLELDLAPDATYADLLHAAELSPHEATVLVDGTPVPEDGSIGTGKEREQQRIEVLRLIKGG